VAPFLALVGCAAPRRAPELHGNVAPPQRSSVTAASEPAPSAAAPAARVTPGDAGPPGGTFVASECGKIPCRLFSDERAAFATLLDPLPAVLAIGESHAQSGSVVEPSVRRFTRDLLPMLAGRASDIVIELMLPNPKCAPDSKKARQEQKVVTEHQAKTDQNDYVALGSRARALGVRPHALEPTCADLSHIAEAGPDVVTVSLDVVTRLATETISRFLSANVAAKDARLVLAYGGLMHNDLAPRPERARWSFGPTMKEKTSDRYIEVDLVAPEQIEDSPTWRSLPWVTGFDRDAHPDRAVLLSPSPRSYVLVFRRSVTSPAPNGSAEPTSSVPSASPR